MDEKKLIKQLNNLKRIAPSPEWKKNEREILLSQISASSSVENGRDEFEPINLLKSFWQLLAKIPQPALAVILIIVFFFGGGILSLWAARGTKPGDSLYLAKKIGEKTQLAFTFDNKDKARLGIEFAAQRAKELNQVLIEPDNKSKDEKVKKLVNDFKSEINGVKSRLSRISDNKVSNFKNDNKPEPKPTSTLTPSSTPAEASEKAGAVFSASANKEEKGVEVSNSTVLPKAAKSSTTSEAASNLSTSTPQIATGTAGSSANLQEVLKEATTLLNKGDYTGTLNKLDEASQTLSGTGDNGQVKGETASSTEIKIDKSGKVLGAEETASSSAELNTADGQASSSEYEK